MMTYEGVDKGKSAHDTTLKELELPPRMTELLLLFLLFHIPNIIYIGRGCKHSISRAKPVFFLLANKGQLVTKKKSFLYKSQSHLIYNLTIPILLMN